MAVVLVDYENVCSCDGLKGTRFLNDTDSIFIFYSACCKKIPAEYMKNIDENGCEFHIHKLIKTSKNGLDFYIATECGIQYEKGKRQIAIVSRDKGFGAVLDYFKNRNDDELHIVQADNIERALLLLDEPQNIQRRSCIKEKTKMLELEQEYVRIRERITYREKLKDILKGSNYEFLLDSIMEHMCNDELSTPKQMYAATLHKFGRERGTQIYRMIKEVV